MAWLVRSHLDAKQMGARQLTAKKLNRLEQMWKPESSFENIERPGIDEEP
ncbi:hypothetical protein DAPPUDRAFT_256623 [Daphnia pulex]|uniref:Uncharacterized protein n=1 Tax=Daphnia pulex TaxID=6669 RepID=E9HBS9_DAPPU|nr:hypothetical protein DAPPUDRAFT_256623 [Daphnia pulex]|eukprot:EFX70818.1 hypothetical protein DAPPUDRAFT_256623 [Daphnia pulex]